VSCVSVRVQTGLGDLFLLSEASHICVSWREIEFVLVKWSWDYADVQVWLEISETGCKAGRKAEAKKEEG
jgi:hypothetical protein